MRKLHGIILHASATRPKWMEGRPTSEKVAEIKRWHVQERGWSDIGYHYLIDRDGTVATGRPIERIGAHVRGHNTGTIGICLLGGHGSSETDDFLENFTLDQDSAVRDLIAQLRAKYGKLALSGHNEYAAKACPGFNVGEWWIEGLRAPIRTERPRARPDDFLPDAEPTKPTLADLIARFFASIFKRPSK